MQRRHAAAAPGALTVAAFAALPHLLITSAGGSVAFVDASLACENLARRIALRAPLLATPAALLQSDMIAVISECAAQEFARMAPLTITPSPGPRRSSPPPWCGTAAVPAHRWLRELVIQVARTAG